jgi:hypothetical protein
MLLPQMDLTTCALGVVEWSADRGSSNMNNIGATHRSYSYYSWRSKRATIDVILQSICSPKVFQRL